MNYGWSVDEDENTDRNLEEHHYNEERHVESIQAFAMGYRSANSNQTENCSGRTEAYEHPEADGDLEQRALGHGQVLMNLRPDVSAI